MKLRINLKDPDGVANSLQEAVEDSVNALEGITDDEREELMESRQEQLREEIEHWVEWDEYVTIEIDTEAGTAVVIPVGQ